MPKPKQSNTFLNSFLDYLRIVFRVDTVAEKKEKTSAVSDIETVDATSSKWKELSQKFGIQSFPTVVVSADSFQQTDSGLLAVLKSKLAFALKEGFLVMPEKDLMSETKV